MLTANQAQNLARDTSDAIHLLGFPQNTSLSPKENSYRAVSGSLSPTVKHIENLEAYALA